MKTTNDQVITVFDNFLAPYGLNVGAGEVHSLNGDAALVISELADQ